MHKNLRVRIGLIGNLLIFFWGISRIFAENTIAFIPVILAVGGFIGVLGSIYKLKKLDIDKRQS
ncbi:hypothetical protein GCM10007216_06250 [Thalassobacillus devorans]|uniref:Uncharacterized protein n=1 Tax=Thalassobacillus devorans TaxID=279813 RepID=A0ABQ1NJ29_9BACI|nr:hypothetical protein [Thalassobacillus devorans]NIK27537.1 hypothetical protein [Thalassobacillus devorans]GGC78519.1 hypothetical protein GCM10007216_06250 [Thalassobacillus devorans]